MLTYFAIQSSKESNLFEVVMVDMLCARSLSSAFLVTRNDLSLEKAEAVETMIP